MHRGADWESVEILGPDEELVCPLCGNAAVVRRHVAYRKHGTEFYARTDWCRSCGREVGTTGNAAA